jgi:hypothetical protein
MDRLKAQHTRHVRRQTGYDAPAFVALDKLPAFKKICEAAGGHGERSGCAAGRPATRARGGRQRERQALLNLICGPGAPRSGLASRRLGEQAAVAGRRLPHAERLTSAG